MSNARFKVWVHGSEVTLTLQPGETLEHHSGGPTDEGYSWTCERWTLSADGTELSLWVDTQARDCDGPLSTYTDLTANACALDNGWPNWQRVHAWQRDAYAEAAGY